MGGFHGAAAGLQLKNIVHICFVGVCDHIWIDQLNVTKRCARLKATGQLAEHEHCLVGIFFGQVFADKWLTLGRHDQRVDDVKVNGQKRAYWVHVAGGQVGRFRVQFGLERVLEKIFVHCSEQGDAGLVDVEASGAHVEQCDAQYRAQIDGLKRGLEKIVFGQAIRLAFVQIVQVDFAQAEKAQVGYFLGQSGIAFVNHPVEHRAHI
ncbi:hypothetical protein BpHYR1_043901 [Brachionus plicatilis]|uniref:Uncharacterized protein n=1 Tax=Brachionus plicatilis TaxID=10195 RepID=A0A3M7SS97_BRAPC|nr:hypothetical protein BpHYR1_043901 [Brachionus plicatilis]